MSMGLLLVLGVLLWTSSAGSNVTQLFVQTGSGVTLDIMDPGALKDYFVLQWKFNTNKVLVSTPPNGEATVNSERVEFHPQNSSVTLKNLQKTDSGLYDAELTTNTGRLIISRFSISVQAPVSPVTVAVDSVSHSSESCNFTVSCTTDHFTLSHSFTCNTHSCEDQEEVYTKPTSFGTSLHLHLSNVSIICNHSNQVSWTNHTQDIPRACPLFVAVEPSETDRTVVYIGVGVGVGVVVVVIIIVVYIRQRGKSQRVNIENTVYEVPQKPTQQPVSPTVVAPVQSPTSTYSLLGPPTAPAPAQSPESLYATVDHPLRS